MEKKRLKRRSLLSRIKYKWSSRPVLLVFLPLVLSLASCSSKKLADEKSPFINGQAIWSGKIHFNKNNKKKTGDITLWLKKPDKMRGDVTAILGIPVASFAKDGQNFSLYNYREGEYYTSTSGLQLIRKLTGVAIDPAVLMTVLSNKVPKTKPWLCTVVDKLPTCNNETEKIKMVWAERNHSSMDVSFLRSKTKVRLKLSKETTTSRIHDRVFKIKSPM